MENLQKQIDDLTKIVASQNAIIQLLKERLTELVEDFKHQ